MGMPGSVHGFGKLPIAGDFIRYRIDSEEAKAFAGWVEKGQALVEAVNRSAPSRSTPAPAPRRRYLFALDQGARMLAAGVIHESNDRGGLRRFPFAFFASVEAAPFRSRPALLPLLLREVWQSLEDKMLAFKAVAKMEDLLKGLEGFALALPAPTSSDAEQLDRSLRGERFGAFWQRALPGAEKDRRVLVFDVMVRALRPFAAGRPEEAAFALKLPIGGTFEESAIQAAFWVDLLSSVLKGSRTAPSLFLEAPEEGKPPKCLHLFFQRPDEMRFASLMTAKYESEYVDDLTRDLTAMKSGMVLAESQKKLLLSDDVALMDIARARWM